MSDKSLVKDAKMLTLEEHFNDDIEDILWRLREVERKSMDEIAKTLSFNNVTVSVDEIATWLSYLSLDELVPVEMLKPTQDTRIVPPRPKKKTGDKVFDPNKGNSVICEDTCVMASYCKYYERYFGKRCIVDLQSKSEFASPITNYINKTYDRDPELKSLYVNIADQIASIFQIMKRKERYLNVKGITQIERKIDPSSGKMVENEVPNPLAAAILQDNKQIMAMLKEMGLTPKSMSSEDTGESDPASLSRALQLEEEKKHDQRHLVEIKQDRYKNRPMIANKDQLLNMIQEKIKFDAALKGIQNGDAPISNLDAPPMQNKSQDLMESINEPSKILNETTNNLKETTQEHNKIRSQDVQIPSEVMEILKRMEKNKVEE